MILKFQIFKNNHYLGCTKFIYNTEKTKKAGLP